MARRFGPTLGAGVVVIETPPEKTITPAPTGVTCYVGQVERGDVGEIIACPTRSDFVRKCGGYLDGTQVPDSAFDFYNLGGGAGELFVVRITDGLEVASDLKVYGRKTGHGAYAGPLVNPSYSEAPQLLMTLSAKNGGRWGGRKRSLSFSYDAGTQVTETTIATGVTMLKNEFKDAMVTIAGVTSKSYKVLSNDTAGVLTVEADSTMLTDQGSTTGTQVGTVYLDNEDITFPASLIGTRKGLSVSFVDGQETGTGLFGMRVFLDDNLVLEYPNLSLDPAHQYYAATVINEDTSNCYVSVAVEYAGSVGNDQRPADWYGQALDWSSNVLTGQYWHVAGTTFTNANAAWVDTFTEPAGAKLLRARLKCTYASSGTKWTVTTVSGYGHELELGVECVVASGVATFTSPDIHLPNFKIRTGAAGLTNGDIIHIDIEPFPVDKDGNGLLKGGYLYYDVGTDARARLKIDSNTANQITLTSAPSSAPAEAAASTAAISGTALSYPITFSGTAFTVEHSGVGTVVMDFSGVPRADAAAVAAIINASWQGLTGSTGVIAYDAGGGAIELKHDAVADPAANDHVGYESFIRLVHNATATECGFAASGISAGTLGAEFRVQAPKEAQDGYDGDTPDSTQFLTAWNTDTSPINRLFGRNKGLVKLAMPGISASGSSTTLQKAAIAYAEAKNYQYRIEVPSGTTDDSAMVAYINDTIGRNDFAVVSFPSHGYVPNPFGDGVVLRSLTGSIHGREAMVAGNFTGYHKAAAGLDVTLPNVSKLPTGERVLNEELLNPQGINVIKKVKGNFILWGDRTVSLDPGWKWKHQRELMSYYENILREEFDFIIFAINDAATQNQLLVTLQAFFIPEWQKRALRGAKFKDAASFKIDDENNTNLTRANGDLNAEIKLRLADTVERFIIRIGKAGIFEDLG